MNKFTIYCTSEQTKKALELGAPLEYASSYNAYLYHEMVDFISEKGRLECAEFVIPTAEQMLGWIREKNIHIVIHKDVVDKWSVYGHEIAPIEITVFDRLIGFDSYEEATLAAIDSALEYLESLKQ